MTISDFKEQRVYVKFWFKIWKPASEMPEMKLGYLPLGPRSQTVVLLVEMPILLTSADSEAYYFEHQGHVGDFFFTPRAFF